MSLDYRRNLKSVFLLEFLNFKSIFTYHHQCRLSSWWLWQSLSLHKDHCIRRHHSPHRRTSLYVWQAHWCTSSWWSPVEVQCTSFGEWRGQPQRTMMYGKFAWEHRWWSSARRFSSPSLRFAMICGIQRGMRSCVMFGNHLHLLIRKILHNLRNHNRRKFQLLARKIRRNGQLSIRHHMCLRNL